MLHNSIEVLNDYCLDISISGKYLTLVDYDKKPQSSKYEFYEYQAKIETGRDMGHYETRIGRHYITTLDDWLKFRDYVQIAHKFLKQLAKTNNLKIVENETFDNFVKDLKRLDALSSREIVNLKLDEYDEKQKRLLEAHKLVQEYQMKMKNLIEKDFEINIKHILINEDGETYVLNSNDELIKFNDILTNTYVQK